MSAKRNSSTTASARLNSIRDQVINHDNVKAKNDTNDKMTDDLASTLATGLQDGKIPHAIVFATNADVQGTFRYSHTLGKVSSEPNAQDIEEDAVFQLASQSKLVATIAALQAMEQGLISLDDDVAPHLPELAEQKIIKGFGEDGNAILVERKKAITLRHLLTHSSGTSYSPGDPRLVRFVKQQGRKPGSGGSVVDRFSYPLLFEPGESWCYSSGIDWAGLLVERVAGESLEEFMKKNIYEPLGVSTLTFFPSTRTGLEERIPKISARTPEGVFAPYTEPFLNDGSTGCMGGHGMYSTMADYIKVLQSILANDGRLLKPATVEQMFTPQLSAESKAGLKASLSSPFGGFVIGEVNPEIESDWGLGGLLYMQDYGDGRRKKGTLSWGGMANCFWTIDREANLALTFGTQVLPPGDKPTEEMITAVEKAVYKKAGVY